MSRSGTVLSSAGELALRRKLGSQVQVDRNVLSISVEKKDEKKEDKEEKVTSLRRCRRNCTFYSLQHASSSLWQPSAHCTSDMCHLKLHEGAADSIIMFEEFWMSFA